MEYLQRDLQLINQHGIITYRNCKLKSVRGNIYLFRKRIKNA